MNETQPGRKSLPRPQILINVAMTVDGKLDTISRRGATISSAEDKKRVDSLRACVDAIMVGGKTLLQEDPRLTVRSEELRAGRRKQGKTENPAKVGVVSRIGEEDLSAKGEFLSAGSSSVILFTTAQTSPATIQRLQAAGAQVQILGEKRVDIARALNRLHAMGIRTLLVEGGGTLLAELFRLDVVDEVTAYVAPRIFGGSGAPTLADGDGFNEENAPRCQLIRVENLDEAGGILIHYKVIHKE